MSLSAVKAVLQRALGATRLVFDLHFADLDACKLGKRIPHGPTIDMLQYAPRSSKAHVAMIRLVLDRRSLAKSDPGHPQPEIQVCEGIDNENAPVKTLFKPPSSLN